MIDNRAKQIQDEMRRAMGVIPVTVKVPWDAERVLQCEFRKLKTRAAHGILYGCLLPAVGFMEDAFKVLKGSESGEDAGAFEVVKMISKLPEIVSEDKFWSMAETLLIGMTVNRKEVTSLDDFEDEDFPLLYLLVFHAVKVNLPFFKLPTMMGSGSKSRNTTGEKTSE